MKRVILSFALLLAFSLAGFAQANIETVPDNPTGYVKATTPYYFGSIDGVLYIFNGKDPFILVRYPEADPRSSFTIPATVARIGQGAFRNCQNLEELIIPASVHYIADNAFDKSGIQSFRVLGNDITSNSVNRIDHMLPDGIYDINGLPTDGYSSGINIEVNGGKGKKVMVK